MVEFFDRFAVIELLRRVFDIVLMNLKMYYLIYSQLTIIFIVII